MINVGLLEQLTAAGYTIPVREECSSPFRLGQIYARSRPDGSLDLFVDNDLAKVQEGYTHLTVQNREELKRFVDYSERVFRAKREAQQASMLTFASGAVAFTMSGLQLILPDQAGYLAHWGWEVVPFIIVGVSGIIGFWTVKEKSDYLLKEVQRGFAAAYGNKILTDKEAVLRAVIPFP